MKTVIATTTWYDGRKAADKVRLALACKMLKNVRHGGRHYPTVVLNGTKNRWMNQRLREAADENAIIYPCTVPGMGPGRRLAFFYALTHLHITLGQKDGVILWTEPEKPGLIDCIGAIVRPIILGEADVVIPKRTEANFGTYPEWQAEIEHEYNSVYEEVTGRVGFDPAFGPVAFRASTLQKLLFWNPVNAGLEDTYITHYLPILVRNERVTAVEVDVPYPENQRLVEEKSKKRFYEKRLWQKATYIKAYRALGPLPKLV
ncbi:MAG: hypothetical protein WC745_01605 [Patescibacteria group bacterium]|jgi:hypothetical protein